MSEFELFLATILIFGIAAISAIVRRERRLNRLCATLADRERRQ